MSGLPINKYGYTTYGGAYYKECTICQGYTWHKNLVDGICLFCVLLSHPFSLKIRLGESKSKSYKKAKAILESIQTENNNQGVIHIAAVSDLCPHAEIIKKLISIAGTWKSFSVELNGKSIDSNALYDMMNHLNRILDIETASSVDVSEDGQITFTKGERPLYAEGDCVVSACQIRENLPYPYVCYPSHYGAFIGFRETATSDVYLCECAKEAIEYFLSRYDNKHDIKNNFPKPIFESYSENQNTFQSLNFKRNLCHVCNQTPPKLRWCIPMYGSESDMLLGWYFKQERYRYREMPTEHNLKDDVRLRAGIIRWVSETKLYQVIRSIIPSAVIETHAHPAFLNGLEYDIYIPKMKLAIEYQGKQHFEPVNHFGGESAFARVQERDAKKKELSTKQGIDLIYFDYTEEVNESLVRSRLGKYISFPTDT